VIGYAIAAPLGSIATLVLPIVRSFASRLRLSDDAVALIGTLTIVLWVATALGSLAYLNFLAEFA